MGLYLRTLALLLGGALAGLGANALRRDGLAFGAFEAPAACEAAEAAGAPLEIDPPDAIHLCGRSDVVVADARPAARFAEGHVAGAIHLPCDSTGRVAADALDHLAGAHTVIVYGQTTDDALPVAASLRRRLHQPGVRVAVLRGGFVAWDQAGLACASGP